MKTLKSMTVRADEVRDGDEVAVTGVVGTVTRVDHYESGWYVRISICTDWGTEASATFPSAAPTVVGR